MRKYIRIGNRLRDLLMRDEHTYMFDKTHCDYFGELYIFEAVTDEEIVDELKRILPQLAYWNKPWTYRIFHKEPRI